MAKYKVLDATNTNYLPQDNVVFVDVDETLILWDNVREPKEGKVEVLDPYTGLHLYMEPHHNNIFILKRMKGQGMTIIVWSHGGAEWANEVVKVLGLQDQVSLIMKKPEVYMDDIPMEHWGLKRVYISKDLTWGIDNEKE